MVKAYDELPRTPANFVALSPLRYLDRAAYIYPNQSAIIHGSVVLPGVKNTIVAVSLPTNSKI